MHDTAAKYPNLTRVFSLGKSVQGRELWAIEISDNIGMLLYRMVEHVVTSPQE